MAAPAAGPLVFLTPDRRPFFGAPISLPTTATAGRGSRRCSGRLMTSTGPAHPRRSSSAGASWIPERRIPSAGRLDRSAPTRRVLDALPVRSAERRFGGSPKFPFPGPGVPAPPGGDAERCGRRGAVRKTLDAMARGAFTTIWAEASTATPSTRRGSCRTSRRWRTTTPGSSGTIWTPTRCSATSGIERSQRASSGSSGGPVRSGGGFYASQDADVTPTTRRYFTWTDGDLKRSHHCRIRGPFPSLLPRAGRPAP